MQTIPAGTSVFVDIDLKSAVEYTLADNTGAEPVVATFTPESSPPSHRNSTRVLQSSSRQQSVSAGAGVGRGTDALSRDAAGRSRIDASR